MIGRGCSNGDLHRGARIGVVVGQHDPLEERVQPLVAVFVRLQHQIDAVVVQRLLQAEAPLGQRL